MQDSRKRGVPNFGRGKCSDCDAEIVKKSGSHKYCEACSAKRNEVRVLKYALKQGRKIIEGSAPAHRHAAWLSNGADISKREQLKMFSSLPRMPNLVWYHRVAIPFNWAGSKNHLFANTNKGHTFMRAESRYYRHMLTEAIAANLDRTTIRQNKVWIDIFVQKPSHRGDATNFLDMICDAIKDAILLDDRWFSVRSIDWQICKTDPRIFVGYGQEGVNDAQVCSTCGRILEFHMFQKNRGTPNGLSRVCKDCKVIKNKDRRKTAPSYEVDIFG